jgi:polar amino acid transport system substrate-binding protein
MKKILCFAVIAVMCMFLLAACGGGSGSSSGGDTDTDKSATTEAAVAAGAADEATGAATEVASEAATETAPPADASADLAKITEAGKMVIGITNYKPMNYYDENNKLVGFDTEYAEAVCEKLGVKPEFIEIVWDSKQIELDSGNIDAIWNGMTYTEERDENMDFAKPYVKNEIVVVTKKDGADKYKTAADLAGLSIASEGGSSGATAVEENPDLKGGLIEVGSLIDSLMEVKTGASDAAAVDSTMANELVGTGDYADLVILPDIILAEEVLAIGFRTGSDIPAKVDEITAELKESGFLDELAKKYKVAFFYE